MIAAASTALARSWIPWLVPHLVERGKLGTQQLTFKIFCMANFPRMTMYPLRSFLKQLSNRLAESSSSVLFDEICRRPHFRLNALL